METSPTAAKSAPPDEVLSIAAAPAEMGAYLQMMRLKRQFRRGWLRAGIPPAQCESVADHAWGCAMLALLLAPGMGLDPSHCALLALVHELGEIHAGDITPHDGVGPAEKRRREADSLDKVLSALEAEPTDAPGAARSPGGASATLIRAMWQEYEDGQSPSARFVKGIDRLEMGFQAAVYRAEGHGDMADFMASVRQACAGGALEAHAAALDSSVSGRSG